MIYPLRQKEKFRCPKTAAEEDFQGITAFPSFHSLCLSLKGGLSFLSSFFDPPVLWINNCLPASCIRIKITTTTPRGRDVLLLLSPCVQCVSIKLRSWCVGVAWINETLKTQCQSSSSTSFFLPSPSWTYVLFEGARLQFAQHSNVSFFFFSGSGRLTVVTCTCATFTNRTHTDSLTTSSLAHSTLGLFTPSSSPMGGWINQVVDCLFLFQRREQRSTTVCMSPIRSFQIHWQWLRACKLRPAALGLPHRLTDLGHVHRILQPTQNKTLISRRVTRLGDTSIEMRRFRVQFCSQIA